MGIPPGKVARGAQPAQRWAGNLSSVIPGWPGDRSGQALRPSEPELARQLGIDSATRSAQRKIAVRRPPCRESELPLSELIVVDNTPWFTPMPSVAGISELARNLQSGRRLRIRYRRSAEKGASWHLVDPYGLLAKSGRWYLVADVDGLPRLYSLSTAEPSRTSAGNRCHVHVRPEWHRVVLGRSTAGCIYSSRRIYRSLGSS